MSDLFSTLERDGRALSLTVIDTMYRRDPFWNARFGERGRLHADDDAGRHVEHLVTALRLGSPQSFIEYGRWLRCVLTTRGMCTRHLGDNFALLAIAIERSGVPGSAQASAYLRAAEAGLYEVPGEAGVLYRERAAIARAVVQAEASEESIDDQEHLVVYLADATLHGQPARFLAYVEFRERLGAEGVRPLPSVRASLKSLGEVLAARAAEFPIAVAILRE